jgi:hypothetical protein
MPHLGKVNVGDHHSGEISLTKVLKTMVGPWGLEPQTSTVSKRRDYVLPTTSRALGTTY